MPQALHINGGNSKKPKEGNAENGSLVQAASYNPFLQGMQEKPERNLNFFCPKISVTNVDVV
jgi:hypothetical protein